MKFIKVAYILGAAVCSLYSPEANIAIKRKLEEEEKEKQEMDAMMKELVFNQYRDIKATKVGYTNQPYKPHHKRGGSKYM